MKGRFLAFVAAGLLLGACANVLAPPAAIVGTHKITAGTISDAVHRYEASTQFAQTAQQSNPAAVARQYEQIYLARLIRRYIFNARARQLGVSVTSADVDRALGHLRETFPSKAAFLQAVKAQGLDLAELRPLVRDRVLEHKLRARVTHNMARGSKFHGWMQWVVAAYRAFGVNVNPSFGRFDLQTQTIVDANGSFPGAPSPSPTPTPT